METPTKHELWDLETGNLIEILDSKEDALAAIEEYVALEGEEYREMLGMRPVTWHSLPKAGVEKRDS